jgi:hypothetical protein
MMSFAEDDRTIIRTKKVENFKIGRRIKLNCIHYLFIFHLITIISSFILLTDVI